MDAIAMERRDADVRAPAILLGIRLGTRRPRSGRTLRSLPVPEPRADPPRIAAGSSPAPCPRTGPRPAPGLAGARFRGGSAARNIRRRARMGWPDLPVPLRQLPHHDALGHN